MSEQKPEENWLVMVEISMKGRPGSGQNWFALEHVVATGPFTKEEAEEYAKWINENPRGDHPHLNEAYLQKIPHRPGKVRF